MKCLKICLIIVLAALLAAAGSTTYAFETPNDKSLRILFTHDMHDHFLPNKIEKDGQILSMGGYSRLKTAIAEQQKDQPASILVDAGDYSMGSLFQSLFSSEAAELRLMGQMGYDVTTLGNHEFDFRDNGLTRHLYAAKNSGEKLPEIVCSNMLFPSEDKMSKSLLELKNATKAYGIKDYTILERNGLKIGIFGLMGKDACESAPMTEVAFGDIVKSAERTVSKLKEANADVIVCLSHSGTSKVRSESEDEQLAKKVPEIDVIISAHTHTRLDNPIVTGKTIIGSCGEYSNNLGIIDIQKASGGRWKLNSYKLLPVSGNINSDPAISQTIEKYKAAVQTKYLDNFGMEFDEILAHSPFSFLPTEKIGAELKEEPLGNLISDGYIYSVKKAEGEKYEPVDVTVVTVGTMRGSFVKGNITVGDAFISSSLGTGPDDISGYPLISAYLTGRELMDLCEVDASISPIMSSAQLYMSGLGYTINSNRMIFNRVTEAHLLKPDGSVEKLQEKKLYRLVTGLYNAQMLSIVGEKSFGLLSIVPKTKEGKIITDFEAQIIYDTVNNSKNEVKEWLATAEYLKSFKKVNGIPQIPDYYNLTHNRKILENDKSIGAILGHPNRVAIKIYIVIFMVLTILSAGIYVLVRFIKRKKSIWSKSV